MVISSFIRPSNSRMWLAYAIAPAVAPVTFVALILVALGVAGQTGINLNPASVLVLLIMAMTIGLAASYLVAGVVGMPIAFELRKREALNFFTIHLSVFLWAYLLACISCIVCWESSMPSEAGVKWFLYVFVGIAPSALLSATVFWLIVRLDNRDRQA